MATFFSSPRREIARIILFVSSSLFLFPLSESIDFTITRFVSDTKNIVYSGDAVPSSGATELNRVDEMFRVGHIACGKKATDQVDPNSDLGLVEWVWGLHGKAELLSGVDPMLKEEFNAKEVECLMMVGLWCSHPDRSLRPSIRQAIQVLKFDGALPNLPTKMHVPIYYLAPDVSDVSSSRATMTNNSIDLIKAHQLLDHQQRGPLWSTDA
ncbi:hypothetical protein L1987_02762 [Smallanthus sonchifolius]|uniref:Uncharacterized protein n=1 Tax=Smallanthus sonchifolius TaxID=185202 RepID=A0ACB9K8V8_9ASTR|nr:hypothetical protein L1987_02762 [Smallanthus sonchifolius]